MSLTSQNDSCSSITTTNNYANNIPCQATFTSQTRFTDKYTITRYKNLRCFPNCGLVHRERQFCGSPVTVAVTLSEQNQIKNIYVFGTFRARDAALKYEVGSTCLEKRPESVHDANQRGDANHFAASLFQLQQGKGIYTMYPPRKWRCPIDQLTLTANTHEDYVFSVYVIHTDLQKCIANVNSSPFKLDTKRLTPCTCNNDDETTTIPDNQFVGNDNTITTVTNEIPSSSSSCKIETPTTITSTNNNKRILKSTLPNTNEKRSKLSNPFVSNSSNHNSSALPTIHQQQQQPLQPGTFPYHTYNNSGPTYPEIVYYPHTLPPYVIMNQSTTPQQQQQQHQQMYVVVNPPNNSHQLTSQSASYFIPTQQQQPPPYMMQQQLFPSLYYNNTTSATMIPTTTTIGLSSFQPREQTGTRTFTTTTTTNSANNVVPTSPMLINSNTTNTQME
jgi:hypothetical protein